MPAARRAMNLLSTPEFERTLDEVAKRTGRLSRSHVIRDAVRLYDQLTLRVQAGEQVFVGRSAEQSALVFIPAPSPKT